MAGFFFCVHAALIGAVAGAGLGWLRSVPSVAGISGADRRVTSFFGAAIGLVAVPTVRFLVLFVFASS